MTMAKVQQGAAEPAMSPRLAVIGGGWAGCAAAIAGVDAGLDVTLFEMSAQLGGRARRVEADARGLDNGQHILIGAYTDTLRLMKQVGVRTTLSLLRGPLRLVYADGTGLHLEPGHPALALVKGILRYPGWTWPERLSLLRAAAGWAVRGYRCAPHLTVAELCSNLQPRVRTELIDPLCVAALNTPAHLASASVFLRVLKDALLSGAGSSDLLLPRTDLSALFPDPARLWLTQAGATVRCAHRVQRLTQDAPAHDGPRWRVDEEPFDAVVLACSPTEAARLVDAQAPDWAATARALPFEPIVTVYAQAVGAELPVPMMPMRSGESAPAQFVFDHGHLSSRSGLLAFVVSGASDWVARGADATQAAVLHQAQRELARYLPTALQGVRTIVEKRATFLCTPGLQRPAPRLARGLHAAGDFIAGPYPATLEGAVRSGLAAVTQVMQELAARPR